MSNVEKNLNQLGGLIYSQRVLIALTQAGLSREESYEIVQKNALKVWDENADFFIELKKDKRVEKYLDKNELEDLFKVDYHTKNVDIIFKRVFGD